MQRQTHPHTIADDTLNVCVLAQHEDVGPQARCRQHISRNDIFKLVLEDVLECCPLAGLFLILMDGELKIEICVLRQVLAWGWWRCVAVIRVARTITWLRASWKKIYISRRGVWWLVVDLVQPENDT